MARVVALLALTACTTTSPMTGDLGDGAVPRCSGPTKSMAIVDATLGHEWLPEAVSAVPDWFDSH